MGCSEGLLIFQESSVKIDIYLLNKNLICAYPRDQQNHFWISCVYGHHEIQHRKHVWDKLIKFSDSISNDDEGVTIGDFNQVLNSIDKLSFKATPLKGASLFRNCLNHYRLCEIPHSSQFMTWTNNIIVFDLLWEILDRCFANYSWIKSPSFMLIQKFKLTKNEFSLWNKQTFGNLFQRKKIIENDLKCMQLNLDSQFTCQKEKEIRLELEKLEEQEQIP